MATDRTEREAVQQPDKRTGDDQRIVYAPREDATPQAELAALAAAYKFVLDRRGRAERSTAAGRGAEEPAGDDS